ncbi:MAG: efflux RND transporter permease subunit [Alphaproteobacteria bacterium]|nr:efflux RND transporter permease subunit [Alphaproteobacteria bacterium]
MNITDIFIRRPILSMVVSLLIIVLGLRAVFSLPILQYPRTENAVVTVSTTYYGADADIVAGFITTPLENAIAQANGIDYMTSESQNSTSTITANLRMNYNSNDALSEINSKVSSVINQLPPESQQPVVSMSVGQTLAAMYIGFSSKSLDQNAITDYLLRVVQPKLQSVEGVQTAEILGAQTFALRAWLDPQKLAAYNLTAADISTALSANNYISGLGNTKGQMVQVNLNASTDLRSLDEFRRMVVKQENGAIIRLEDVANVTMGSDSYEARVGFDGKEAVYIGVQVTPTANLLEVVNRIRAVFPQIQENLPTGLEGTIVYDSTKFVTSSIKEVVTTLVEAVLIVTVVIFLFLGSPRSVAIPTIAIPLSMIGTFMMMLAFGFSINLLTLLALVLAIGLVVDDAIIVVENVDRHMEEGLSPLEAALKSAHELATPILTMTIVLVAVYVPIGFQSGLTGALFTEFAFTLVGAVTISTIVALTLSPMMCSKILKPHRHESTVWHEELVDWLEAQFERLRCWYERILDASFNYLPVTVVFSLIILGSIFFLYSSSKSELAPQEDQGVVISFGTASPTATLDQRLLYTREAYKMFSAYPETDHVFQLDIPGQSIAGVVLKPWDERKQTASDLQPLVQKDVSSLPGVNAAAIQPSPLPGSRGLPIQFVVKTTENYERLLAVSNDFLDAARKTGMFMFINNDLKVDLPQATVQIDRDKAATLGLTMNEVGSALSSMLGGGYVNYFSFEGRSYKVIPQVEQKSRLNSAQLANYYIRSGDGSTVPLSTIATITTKAAPEKLNHFQQMRSATISGVMFPGIALGNAIEALDGIAAKELPQGYSVDYSGQSRQFVQEKSGFVGTFMFALIIIFLVLSAQFESFRDPITILISVPMAIAGALLFISIGIHGASINIYTQVGLVTLMGLISKHGILIAEFANKLMLQGYSKRRAIVHASGVRLRPILMTTAAMVLGVMPLIFASGAGALSRFNMGLVIAGGLSIGTIFTLFVHPAVVLMIGEDHSKKGHAAMATGAEVPGQTPTPEEAKPADMRQIADTTSPTAPTESPVTPTT